MNIIKNIQKAIAFTLAETLVVMGIIGVVAALTIPNLNQSTGDREKVAKVKKIYANLNDAYGRATAVYGPFEEWMNGIDDAGEKSKRFAERMTEFMKVSKNCEFDEGCFSSNDLLSDNRSYKTNYLELLVNDNFYMIMLADGTSVGFRYNKYPNYKYYAAKITIDIDGSNKGKNQYGNDIFDFKISKDGVEPAVSSDLKGSLLGTDPYATAWVIQNGNMDYLKCFDDLNWDTKTSCK